ncbi:MAG: TonB-dependent receptor domain-containing protein, partial [Bacteroidota bacterium]
ARNDFSAAACSTAMFYMRENFDKEKTAFLNVMKKYMVSDIISGEIKAGGKIKQKSRWMSNSELDDNSYLHSLATVGIDTNRMKSSRFGDYYLNAAKFGAPSLSDFIDHPVPSRDLLGVYSMKPLINTDAMKEWYDLTKNASVNGEVEYLPNARAALSNYSIAEGVTAGYIMNTLNYGQEVSLLLGARVESESNDYTARISTGSISNIGIRYGFTDVPRDSTIHYTETNILPNILLTLRPAEFLTFRLAGYKALARPDFNLRLPTFFIQNSNSSLTVGNPNLKDTKAWNYELNAQVFNNTIGLVSVSVFYKKLDNMFHQMSNVQVDKQFLDSLFTAMDMDWTSTEPFRSLILRNPSAYLTVPYNSTKPSYAWGVEFEHQMNFSFMALNYVNSVTLSYNVSLTRSETQIIGNQTLYRTDSNFVRGRWIVTQNPYHVATEYTRQSEGQPKLYGNAAIGYDLEGFSARLSYFYQDEYVKSYSSDGQSDIMTDTFSKIDLALKQKLTDNISLFMNINNLTNNEETTSQKNQKKPWQIPNTAELYGTTVDLGVKVTL